MNYVNRLRNAIHAIDREMDVWIRDPHVVAIMALVIYLYWEWVWSKP